MRMAEMIGLSRARGAAEAEVLEGSNFGDFVRVERGQPLPPEPDPRERDWLRTPPGDDLFGLALSGGGIRSATFNLGVLQGLNRLGLLPCLHYLSTVSGGGYSGAFWSAWRHRVTRGTERRDPAAAATGSDQEPGAVTRRAGPDAGSAAAMDGPPLFPGTTASGATEHPSIRHLREYSNFLSPRLGLLSVDTGRLVVALLAAALPSILATVALLALVLVTWWA
ncbi:MAG TPA: hypothetical protein VMK65_10815, partial [Longimicrobiales bacterium]|nr:hypothetical protein [Longimicrobiales bacterium]